MADLVNYIKIDGDKLSGNIASLSYDLDLTGEAITSDNPRAPVFRLFGKTPRGRRIEIGGVWKNKTKKGGAYYILSVNTGFTKLHANLGRYPGQDEDGLLAVIPWD